ncbi:Zn-finger transcription factor [Phaffia rhodozyma]|uniref:Zn-finger transcription factor n=1 Tax=Phaffia rhodozyma TaxID=264483 RepID=A0A0F7SRD9_PHARH|nr:Zn-finger transcription factor [Phaffia rhodozyma]
MSYHGGYVPPWELPSNHYNQTSPPNLQPPPLVNADLRWDDFNATLSMINTITVANKMSLIKQLNSSMNLNLKATQALKAELVSRLHTYLRGIRERNDIASYIRFKEIARAYIPTRWNTTSQYKPIQQYPVSAQDAHHPQAISGASGMPHSNSWTASRATPSTPAPPPRKPYKWKNSPLFTVSTPLTDMILVKGDSTDRVAATANFIIPDDIRSKIESSNANPNSSPRYSVRLFCTSSTHYSPSYGQTAAASQGLPVEFPLTCEVRVNYELIGASLKGLKKKPGSCPPADLMKGKTAVHPLLRMGSSNRLELIHINPNGPASKPRYYMQACLVETITSDTLLHTVQKGPRRPVEKVEDFIRHMSDDAEIQMGASGLSLKCPCFEASSWLQINEQTPLWSCPVCEKGLTLDSMFIDDYTDSILKACDSDVDEVIIEPDAAWHTADRKHGTPSWLEANPVKALSDAPPSHQSTPMPSEDKAKEAEIYLLSSDDEDADHSTTHSNDRSATAPPSAAPPVAPTNPGYSAPTHPATSNTDPIDLTLDSDDEDDEQPTQSYTPPLPVSAPLPLLQRLSSPLPSLHPIVKTQDSTELSSLGPSLKRNAPDSEEPSQPPDKRTRVDENGTSEDLQIRGPDPIVERPSSARRRPSEQASSGPSPFHSVVSPVPAPPASTTASVPPAYLSQPIPPSHPQPPVSNLPPPTSSSSFPTTSSTDARLPYCPRSNSHAVPDERPHHPIPRRPHPYSLPSDEPGKPGESGSGNAPTRSQPGISTLTADSNKSPPGPNLDSGLGGNSHPSYSHSRLTTTARPWFYPEPTANVIGAGSGGGGNHYSLPQRPPPHVSPYSSPPMNRSGNENGSSHINGNRNGYNDRNGGHGWPGTSHDILRGETDRR